jgi:hypothetical protein
MAVCCSLAGALTSDLQYYNQNGDAFEDANTKRSTTLHCLAFHVIPMALAILFYILRGLQKRNSTDKMQLNDGGRLVFWLLCTIIVNYAPLHSWLLYSWLQHRIVTMSVVDFATYFPLYSTASWIPVVLYFVLPTLSADSGLPTGQSPVTGSTQTLIQRVPRTPSPGIKQTEPETNHLPECHNYEYAELQIHSHVRLGGAVFKQRNTSASP